MNNSSSPGLLQKLNDEKAVLLIPSMIFVGVLMCTGFFGNIVVCYFYGFKTKTTTTSCFIFGLAIFDLLSCTISMPIEIVDMRFFYMFPNITVCKVLTATNFVFTISSGLILIAIATERYRRICLPFRKQITIVQARLICFASTFIACFFSWPSLVLYTIVTVDVPVPGSTLIHGYDCTAVKEDSLKVYLNAFNIIQILLFIFSVVTLVVLYALVYRQLNRLKDFRRSTAGHDSLSSTPSAFLTTAVTSADKTNKIKDTHKHRGNNYVLNDANKSISQNSNSKMTGNFIRNVTSLTSGKKDMTQETSFVSERYPKLSEANSENKDESGKPITLEQITIQAQHDKEPDSLELGENDDTEIPDRTSGKFNTNSISRESGLNKLESVYSLNRKGSKDKTRVRYTTVMTVITVTFVVSFLPYLCLVAWRSLSADYDLNKMTDLQLIFFSIAIRSYFINSAINPIIYGFYNSQFREFVVSVCTACCGAKPNCERVSDTTDTQKTNT
ncbi:hypothetical protein ACJMK2_000357 [Sinanodonta woodiana]|uniref:G-protein coupled receptors family 1 profile domain-containing protein n=1 Tax=Sinanodonta woodiana TaxID=1069815 RepID=A0ABD3XP05_SINWO